MEVISNKHYGDNCSDQALKGHDKWNIYLRLSRLLVAGWSGLKHTGRETFTGMRAHSVHSDQWLVG